LGAQFILQPVEFLECPPGEFDHHVIARGGVFVEGSRAPVWYLRKGKTASQPCRHQGNGKSRGLRGEGRGARRAGIDFDNHHPVGYRVVGKLHVGASDYPYRFNNGIGIALKALLQLLRDGEHGSCTERIASMDAHGVYILNETNGDHLVFGVADHLEFQLLPPQHRLLDKYLVDETDRKTPACHHAEFLHIIDHTTADAPHGIGWAHHHRVTQSGSHLLGILHRIDGRAASHLNTQGIHHLLKGNPVLPLLDGVGVHTDYLHTILFKDSLFIKQQRKVQRRLSAQVGQQRIRPFLADDLFQGILIQRLDIGDVGHLRVGHDGGRIGVDQHDLIPQGTERFARLRSGVIKFTCLSNDDRSRPDDQYLANVISLRHDLLVLSAQFRDFRSPSLKNEKRRNTISENDNKSEFFCNIWFFTTLFWKKTTITEPCQDFFSTELTLRGRQQRNAPCRSRCNAG